MRSFLFSFRSWKYLWQPFYFLQTSEAVSTVLLEQVHKLSSLMPIIVIIKDVFKIYFATFQILYILSQYSICTLNVFTLFKQITFRWSFTIANNLGEVTTNAQVYYNIPYHVICICLLMWNYVLTFGMGFKFKQCAPITLAFVCCNSKYPNLVLTCSSYFTI